MYGGPRASLQILFRVPQRPANTAFAVHTSDFRSVEYMVWYGTMVMVIIVIILRKAFELGAGVKVKNSTMNMNQ